MAHDPQAVTLQPGLGELLHFSQTLDSISGNCVTAVAANQLRQLQPTTSLAELEARFDATDELCILLERGTQPALDNFPDLDTPLRRLELGSAALNSEELHHVSIVLKTAAAVGKSFVEHTDLPYWQAAAGAWDPWPEGAQRIDAVIDDDLTIKSTASKQLQAIRRTIARQEAQVRKRLGDLHSQALTEGWGQEEPVAWREGRLVIALKTSHKRKIKGLVHGYSGSGATAFVEPLEVFERNNEIAALHEDERAEIARLLAELTDQLRPCAESLAACVAALYELDIHLALARWARQHKAVRPVIEAGGRLHLAQARNPVLVEHREVVPLDLQFGDRSKVLLISGPNAGGKTVVLLTVGLFAMLAQSGVFLPADEARLPLFYKLFADLGDRQSLENDLSTFSAHLTNLQTITRECDGDALVLLDELGTGTEPEAGAALGQTFLENIMANGAFCLATTHLNRLKLWAQDQEGIQNAGMEFDPAELAPTYKLQPGQPGASYALEIARRIGLEEELLTRAEELMPEAAVNLEELLVSLREDRAVVDRLQSRLAEQEQELRARESAISVKEGEIKATHRRARKDALHEAEQLVKDLNRQLERTITEVRTKGGSLTGDDIRQAKAEVSREKDRITAELRELAGEVVTDLAPADLKEGLWVNLRDQNRVGQVIKVSRGGKRVTLEVEGTRLTVSSEQLAAADPPQNSDEAAPQGMTRVNVSPAPGGYSLDLRGERGEAAVARVGQFIDQAIVGNLRELEIIHGKGTGILQKLVWELLEEHPQVLSYQFADFDAGGTGVTIVVLK